MHLVSPEYIGGVQNVLAVCDGGIFSSKASFYYFLYIHPLMSDKYKYTKDFDVMEGFLVARKVFIILYTSIL